MTLVSPCCSAKVHRQGYSADDMVKPGHTYWYECDACGQPCDPVEKEEEA